MSTFRTTPKAEIGTVYNVSLVKASQWNAEGLDGMLTFLAASRHLQMPQCISRPLGDTFCNNDGIGDARISLRCPAFTGHIDTTILGRTVEFPGLLTGAIPGFGMTQELDSGAGFGNISFIPTPTSGDDVTDADWSATDPQALNDSPTDYECFPLSFTYDDTENDSLIVRIDCTVDTKIYVTWFQSSFLPTATLST